jgi:hypothetical protein
MAYQPNLFLQFCKQHYLIYKVNLLLLLIVASVSMKAQQIVFDKQVCERRTPVELSSITDSAKQTTCIFMLNTDSIKAIVFNNKLE